MTSQPWHVCVLIPARNEEGLLPRCLDSVIESCKALCGVATYDIVVAVDCSTDRTLSIAESMIKGHGAVVHIQAGIVGVARAVAAETALDRYNGPLERCWLANTDADSVVSSNWLFNQIELADQGLHAMAGTIQVDSFVEHDQFVPERFRTSYLIHPDGSHPHVHGANLGVRADTYLLAAGWSSLHTAEDHDLWNRIGALGVERISISHAPVLTSGRRQGRAPLGFAGALAAHNESAA